MADPRLKRFGLSGYNKPKRTPRHKTKSHVVLARYKKGGRTVTKLIRFGQQGVKTNQISTANYFINISQISEYLQITVSILSIIALILTIKKEK